jgi:hypothetical protein
MSVHPPGTKLHRGDGTHDLLAAPAAKPLTRLYRGTASVAEHDFLLRSSVADYTNHSTDDTEIRSTSSVGMKRKRAGVETPSDYESANQSIRFHRKTKRPPGNRMTFSFQGRIVPTEA